MPKCQYCASDNILKKSDVYREYMEHSSQETDPSWLARFFIKDTDPIFDALKPPRQIRFFNWAALVFMVAGVLLFSLNQYIQNWSAQTKMLGHIGLVSTVMCYWMIFPLRQKHQFNKWMQSSACGDCQRAS